MAILTKTACEIIGNEAHVTLQELASRDLNTARQKSGVEFVAADRARGATRVMAGLTLSPADIEKIRETTSKLRLPKKPTGVGRLVHYFL